MKKGFLLLLPLFMMLSLCGCSDKKKDPQSTPPSVTAPTEAQTSVPETPEESTAESTAASAESESAAEHTETSAEETTEAPAELTAFDPFLYVSVVLEGVEPEGQLHAVYRGPYPLSLKQDTFEGLSNGSTVLLEIEPATGFDPSEAGIRIVNGRSLYFIEGLAHRLADPHELSRESLRRITELVNADILESVQNSWADPDSFCGLVCEDVLLDETEDGRKLMTVVFRADVSGDDGFSYYTYAQFEDVTVRADGSILNLGAAYRSPSSQISFGRLYGDGFEKNGRFYTGFETKEALLKAAADPAEESKATLLTVGDMLLHASLFPKILQPDGSYSYDFVFENMGEIFAGRDLVIANNEAIIGGNEYGMRGYPGFNARTEFGDAEIRAGINVVLHANNHARDLNLVGIRNCLAYWKENHPEMTVLGIHESAEAAAEITVLEVNGIRIALLNYTDGLNGLVVPDDQSYLVDRMDESTWDKVGDDIRRAEELADFIVVFPHWGTEYMLQPNYNQKRWAKWFIENGADLIIGNHPHCPQPVEWVTASNGNQGLCYYSLGNFISNQSRTISCIGEIALVEITKKGGQCYISDCDVDFEITFFTPSCEDHQAIPLTQFTEELARKHAAVSDPKEGEINNNIDYPMSLETIRRITDGIRSHLSEQRDARK
jgi:poly-gamma-glutamate synthesis protein (capsule biosynthesis protein)